MQLANEHVLPVGQAEAWRALNDTELLRASIPGCESLTPAAEAPAEQFDVLVVAAVGPVKAKFKGKLRLTDVAAPHHYTMHFEGQGGPAGFGKGSAKVDLEPISAAETRLRYTAQAQVGGRIAQVGSRLVDMAAQKMAQDFFANFTRQLQQGTAAAAAPPPAAAPMGWWQRLVAWFKGLAGAR